MAPSIFLTGTTGYIGGSVLATLASSHPEYKITALLRTVPDKFKSQYPQVDVVKGDYDSFDILAEAASKADIVVHSGDSDHEPSIQALITGLLRTATRSSPKHLIHLSGTGIIADYRDLKYHGILNPKLWSDITDIKAITSLPATALHRNVDSIIQAAAQANSDVLKTAIVCPPDLYGRGRGPGRDKSILLRLLVSEAEKFGATFYVGKGENTRSWTHIDDLMIVYRRLVEEAVKDLESGNGSADWGIEGYYFAASQEVQHRVYADAVGKLLKERNIVKQSEAQRVELEEVKAMLKGLPYEDIGVYMFVGNSRSTADRARKVLGYEPKEKSVLECLEDDLNHLLE